MGVEENKQVVRAYCSLFKQSAIADVLDMMTDDATWWVIGKPALFVGAGTKTKREMQSLWGDLYAKIEGGLEMNIIGMIGEGDRVAAEVRSYATMKNGRIYENDYHILFTLRDGKIASTREYTDLLHVDEIFE